MSSESINNSNSIKTTLVSSLAFPAVTTTVGALGSIKRNHGVRAAMKACNKEGFEKLATSLQPIHKDIFSRSIALSQNYEEYKTISKKAAKTVKKAVKAQDGKIPFMDKVLNLFRKEKVTPESIIKSNEANLKQLDDTVDLLKNGKEIVKTSTKSGFKNTAKTLFKNEIKNPLVIALTALEIVPEITGKVIPAFKNEGFKAGLVQTGKSILKVGSNFVSYAAGGVLGRVIGASIGTIICPGVGSAVGANVGDMIGSALIGSTVTKAVDKVMGEDEAENASLASSQEQGASQIESIEPIQETEQLQQQMPQQEAQNTQVELNQQTKNESLIKPTFKEARAMYATESPKLGKSYVKRGYQKPQNGVYATQWVNDMAQAKRQAKLNTLS